MRLYGEVRHSHGPLFRWTANEMTHGHWKVMLHSRDHFYEFTVVAPHQPLAATRTITEHVIDQLIKGQP